MYLLTPKGISEKTQLTINFMKRKLKEYDELKKKSKIQKSHKMWIVVTTKNINLFKDEIKKFFQM